MALFNVTEREIQALAGNRKSYELGVIYAQSRKVSKFNFDPEQRVIKAIVSGNWRYDVRIVLNQSGTVSSAHCTCPAYAEYPGACKHVVAVLKTARQKLSAIQSSFSDSAKAGSEFMTFISDRKQENPPEELNLEVGLQLSTVFRKISAQLQLKVGLQRPYVVKNLKDFLLAVKNEHALDFGAKFTYDPTRHKFKETDAPLIAMLQDMLAQYEAFQEMRNVSYFAYAASPFSQKPFVLSTYYLGKLLDALGSKSFSLHAGFVNGYETTEFLTVNIRRQNIPLDFSVEAEEQNILLLLQNEPPVPLTADGRYYLYNRQIYQVCQEQTEFLPNLLKALSGKQRPGILFTAVQKDRFASEALPLIQKMATVSIEPTLADRFIREDLQPKIYFDRAGENGITARLEFHYGEILINPFSRRDFRTAPGDDQILIRDLEQERKIVSIFEQADFIVSEGKISLEDDEKIFDFTVKGFPELQDLAEIYYSDDFRLTIQTSATFSGRIRLDESLDMLEVSFTCGDIDPKELADIFQSLRMKKKYYRLRDGSFLDLQQHDLEAMSKLLDHLDLKGQDLTDQTLHLPKFRALYIDSFLRQAELSGIQRNKAFKQLVQSILEPQDGEYDPPPSLHQVLRDYQKTGFKWLKTLASYGLGGILADDMGLGKTLQVLAFILSAKLTAAQNPTSLSPFLVIAPTSLVYNWQSEAEKFTPDLHVLVIEGQPAERREQISRISSADLVVISYAVLRRDIEQFAKLAFSYCFLDEAQNIKNPQTLNAKSVQKIQAKGYFALTGTPIENSLAELWSIFHFIMPGYLPSHQEFHKKYALPVSKGDTESLQELSRQIKPFILRRLKIDVLKELPPKIETEIKAALTDEQRKIYLAYLQQTKRQLAEELAVSGFAKSQIKILAALTRLRQICSHPAMFIENYTGGSGKMLLFQEILTESLDAGHRILVFSQFTSMLDLIQDDLNRHKIAHFYLSGSTKALERTQMAQAFNDDQGKVFLISLRAGGTGLNLTGADTVIHFDPWWNPAVEDQATDRAHRIGQNNSVQVIKLLTQGTIEEKVNALQAKKKKLIDSVIRPGETMLSKLTEQELNALFDFDL
jgi:SNF2 family DNA or RNA helicase